MKILFVSGKGGVGKSTVAAALALKSAQDGQKTLLVELGSRSFFADALSRKTGYQPVSWRDGVDLAVWDGPSCLREYALHLIKSETLYNLFFENPVSRSLIQVAPGLAELAILGKITSGPPRKVGPQIPYDTLVIDAFASGHFMALLKAPKAFAEVINLGPMAEQTTAILKVLKDPEICSYHFVTLPEELPMQETRELCTDFHTLMDLTPQVWFNRWLPENLDAELASPITSPDAFTQDLQHRFTNQQKAEKQFCDFPCGIAPWILSTQFENVVVGLRDQMHELPKAGTR